MLKFSPDNKVKPTRGSLLLSEPFLNDDYFKRTVILLCEHNDEGSFGFVLNNYLEVPLHTIMPELPDFRTRVSLGGPVKNSNMFYIHSMGDRLKDSLQVSDNIYMGGDFNELKKLSLSGQISEDEIRFFVGYSGWSAGQLQSEIEMRSWFVSEIDEPLIMNSHVDDLWGTFVGRLGTEYAHLANTPPDPSLN